MSSEDFNFGKFLPASVVDFVLKDNRYGIASPEFKAALKRGDLGNIVEGIDSAIINSEIMTKVNLSDTDKAKLQVIAHNHIAKNLNSEFA